MKKSQIEELFRAHYATMYRFALSMLYDEDESRDVASDVFAKVFENNITLRPDTARHYLMTAVRSRCLNIIEQKKLHERVAELYLLNEPVCSDDTDDAHLHQITAFIHDSFHGTAAEVLRMKFACGMESKDVAQALGISTVAVYKHLAKALEIIKTNFNKNI